MRSLNNFLKQLESILDFIFVIPVTIVRTLFALLVIIFIVPIQIIYYMSDTGKKARNRCEQNHIDQSFKRAIALIELHKIRFGDYPVSLQEEDFQKFMGGWDGITEVTYLKRKDGYELHLNSQDSLQLEYPPMFWNGLGLVRTNVRGFDE